MIDAGNVSINQKSIPIRPDGKVLVNLAAKSAYQKRTYSLLAVIERAKRGQDISVIEPGDYVVILPGMFTGSTDFVDTPFGSMPGGFIMVATLQSALSGNWLSQVKDPGLFVVFFGLLGFVIAVVVKPTRALLTMLVSGCGLSLISIHLFVYFEIAVSFILPVSALFVGTIFGVVLSSSLLALDDERRKRELEVASTVQKTFFSKNTLGPSLVSVDGFFSPASECGGDWWGCFSKNGYSYVMIGDALGHGVPAALMTATIYATIRILEEEHQNGNTPPLRPSEILKKLNSVVHSMSSVYITFQIFRFDENTGTCEFSNAGHCPPVIIPIEKSDARLPKGRRGKMIAHSGNVLGSDNEGNFVDHVILTAPGDKILLYSDGLIENQAAQKTAPGGKMWLTNTLRILDERQDDPLRQIIWTAYLKRIGDVEPLDDVTIVTIDLKNFKPQHD
jgi:serine phosphatase RsbU (regulator of sigma subunit)